MRSKTRSRDVTIRSQQVKRPARRRRIL